MGDRALLVAGMTTRMTRLNDTDLLDRAWWILLGGALCMFCGQPATILFTFGIFSPVIVAATGWSAVSIAGAVAPGVMAGALLAPVIGRVGDRIGPRKVVIYGGPAYAAGLVLLAYGPTSPVTFTLCLAIASSLGFAAIPIIYAQLVAGWFARRRGLALSLLFTATSIGIGVWSLYVSTLLPRVGWRHTYALVGLAAGTIILLAGVLLVRDPPAAATRAQAAAPGLTVAEAVRSRLFWILMVTFLLLTGILSGCTVTLPVILRHMDVDPLVAASVIPVVGVGMLFGRLSAGVLLDRWFAPYVTAAFVGLSLIGMILMWAAPSSVVLFASAALLAAGIGAELDAAAYIVSRAFGLRSFGAIYGLITLGYGVSGAIGTGLVGAAVAKGVAPTTVFAIGIAVLAMVVVLLTTIRPRDLSFGGELLA